MTPIFEELDSRDTPLGEISLRRRSEPGLQGEIVWEVKLGDEFLMSSLFTAAEVRLADLGLAALEIGDLDVVVGGLGLGYTAAAALKHPSVRSLTIVELLEPVIDWHRRGLVPLGRELTSDPRCRFVHHDFFAMNGWCGGPAPPQRFHAVLLDIDHSPAHWLNPRHAAFYTRHGLQRLAGKLHPGGVFGLWSNDPPDAGFNGLLDHVFATSTAHVITFPNPYTGGESSSTVYVANKGAD